jgi:23S rRNA pseudouridine2605 synthase
MRLQIAKSVIPLNRALSKLGILSRAQATVAIRAGRVRVGGRVVRDPLTPVVPGHARIEIDGHVAAPQAWRTILFHKPRGVMTTRRDPQGRPTIYGVLGSAGQGLVAVGRLDLATSGLIVLTTDTGLADWIADPANEVPRVYVVTVRGKVEEAEIDRLTRGMGEGRDRLRAAAITVRKSSSRESHVTVELREGKNREVRRLFAAIGHEVTRLKRVRLGGLDLGAIKAGEWRALSAKDIIEAFPYASVRI